MLRSTFFSIASCVVSRHVEQCHCFMSVSTSGHALQVDNTDFMLPLFPCWKASRCRYIFNILFFSYQHWNSCKPIVSFLARQQQLPTQITINILLFIVSSIARIVRCTFPVVRIAQASSKGAQWFDSQFKFTTDTALPQYKCYFTCGDQRQSLLCFWKTIHLKIYGRSNIQEI